MFFRIENVEVREKSEMINNMKKEGEENWKRHSLVLLMKRRLG